MSDVTSRESFSELETREEKHFAESTLEVANVLNCYFVATGSCDIVVDTDSLITLYQLLKLSGVGWE
jgi:hydroxyethylthiazole kinase-like sugar kinase family protein